MPTQARVVSCVTPTIILGGETEYIRKAKNPVLSAPKDLTSQAGRQDLNKANSTRGVERRESQQSEQWHTATAVHSRKTIMSHQKKKKCMARVVVFITATELTPVEKEQRCLLRGGMDGRYGWRGEKRRLFQPTSCACCLPYWGHCVLLSSCYESCKLFHSFSDPPYFQAGVPRRHMAFFPHFNTLFFFIGH